MLTKRVLVKFQYTSRFFSVFKSSVKWPYNDPNLNTKWVLFFNTRALIDKLYQSIQAYFDAESYCGDINQIIGTTYRE